LKDVLLTDLEVGQSLVWNGTSWINADISGGPGVDITLVAGSNIEIVESPDNTFTISANVSGGSGDVSVIESSGGSILVTEIDGGYNLEVATAPIGEHNDLNGLQGIGGDGGYYHLSEDQYNNLDNLVNITQLLSVSGDLQNQIEFLQDQLRQCQLLIDEEVKKNQLLQDKINLLEKENKFVFRFIANRDGYFKIKLYKDEELRVL
jgi:hypothetical protein